MTAAIDITKEQRKTLLALLRRFIPGVAVWAYGSRVKWTARPNSDLDLVAFTTPAQSLLVSELKEALAESNLPFLVDFHVWDEVPERFHEIIRKEYVVLQEAKKKLAGVDKANEWRESTWGEEISLEYGKALRDTESGRFRVFGSNGPIGWTTLPLTTGPGVVLGRKGAYRGVQYSRDPFFVIDTAYYVVPKTQLDMRWVYYAIKHHKLGEIDDGSPIPSTTRAAVYVRDLLVPPPAEQKAIAHILGTLDDKIELNRRMNATLEAMARALFQSWFVDFDPVRAKLDARQPAGLDAATAALFSGHFQDSPLGHIPQGWEVRGLDQIANFLNGLALQKYPPSDGATLPVIKIAQLRKGDSEGADRCNTELAPEYIVEDGDVLFSWSGSLEVELWCGGRGALNQHLFKVTSSDFPKWFYYLWTLYHLDEFRLIAADKATTMGHIQRGHLTAAKVLVPPPALLESMSHIMAPLIDQIIANRAQSRTLATIRDALLPKLLNGELSVSERIAEATT